MKKSLTTLHFEFRMLLRNDNTITINANWFLNIIENLMNGATSEPAAFLFTPVFYTTVVSFFCDLRVFCRLAKSMLYCLFALFMR